MGSNEMMFLLVQSYKEAGFGKETRLVDETESLARTVCGASRVQREIESIR